MGESSYGQFSFIYAYLSFFEVFVQFGLNPILTRKLSQEGDNHGFIIGNAILLRTGLVLATIPLAVFIISMTDYPLTVKQGVYIAAFQLFLTLRPVFEVVFKVRLQMKYPAIANSLKGIVTLILVFFIARNGGGLIHFVCGYLVVGILTTISMGFFSLRFLSIRLRWKGGILKDLVCESFPMLIAGYLTLIYYRVDVLMLSVMADFKDVGLYSVATRLTESLHPICDALLVSYFPLIAKSVMNNREEFVRLIRNALLILNLLALPIGIGGSFAGTELIVLLFGESYRDAGLTLSIMVWFLWFSFIGSLFANVMLACGKQKINMWISFAITVGNVLMNLWLIPQYSHIGAAIATVVSVFLGMLMMGAYVVWHREIRVPLHFHIWLKVLCVNFIYAGCLYGLREFYDLPVVLFVVLGIVIYATLVFLFKIVSWKMVKGLLRREEV